MKVNKLFVWLLACFVLALMFGLSECARHAYADIPHGTYQLRPASPLYRTHRERSCLATRFLKERLTLTYNARGATIGVTSWDVIDDRGLDSVVLGKGRPPNKVFYMFDLLDVGNGVLHGEYVLFGFLATYDGDPYFPHGRPCEDRVRVVGRRVK